MKPAVKLQQLRLYAVLYKWMVGPYLLLNVIYTAGLAATGMQFELTSYRCIQYN